MRLRHRDVVRALLRRAAAGEWADGSMLPREVDLQAEFGVSRGVIREALGALESHGVVSIVHGRGAFLQPRSSWHVLDEDVAETLSESRGRRALLRELVECRLLLEPAATALAAERAAEPGLATLATAVGRLEDGADKRTALAAFHAGVLDLCGNRALAQALRPAMLAHVRHGPRPPARVGEQCRAILEAIAASDPEAARAASRAHLRALDGARST